jgi:hypothetical protein
MLSPYLEEFKPAGGINSRVAVLDQSKVSGVQGHWITARDRTGQEVKGFYSCSAGQCCQIIGAPSQYYLLPIWVYTNLPIDSSGAMMYLKLTKTTYQAFVQNCQINNFSQFDMWIVPTEQGKGIRLAFSAAQDGSYLTQEERQGHLNDMGDMFWDTLDKAVVKTLPAQDLQDVLQFYYAQQLAGGQAPATGQLMNQGARPGMMMGGARPGAVMQPQLGAPVAQPQYQQPQAQQQPMAQPPLQATRPGMQPQQAQPPLQASYQQAAPVRPGVQQQAAPVQQYQPPNPQQQQQADYALQQFQSQQAAPVQQSAPVMPQAQQMQPQVQAMPQGAQPSFMLPPRPQAQAPQQQAMAGDFEVIPEGDVNIILNGSAPIPGNPL